MAETLFFVHADCDACGAIAEEFRGRGWLVETAASPDGDTLERIEALGPTATVFFLEGCEVAPAEHLAQRILEDGKVHRPLLVFVGGAPDAVAEAKAAMPFGVFVRADELGWVLKHLTFKG